MKPIVAFLALSLMVAALPPALVFAKPPAKKTAKPVQSLLPAPRAVWQIPGWIPGESTVDGVQAATERMLVLGVTHRFRDTVSRRIVVLNRSRDNVQRTYEPERINLRDQSIRADWRVLGSVAARLGNTITYPQLILERQILFIGARASAARVETEFYGMDETGRIQWQYPPANATGETEKRSLSGAPLFGNLLPVRTEGSDTLELWDAQTGVPIDRTTPDGKAAIASAIGQVGSALVQVGDKWFRVDTGASLPIPHKPSGDEQIVPLGVTADRAFWRVGGDDGFMGHGAWPTYLIAGDASGKLAWQFPTFKDADYLSGGANAPSFNGLTVLQPPSGSAVALVSLASGVFNAPNALYGLRAQDGGMLWKRTWTDGFSVAAPKPNADGVFVLRVPNEKPSSNRSKSAPVLEYLNAATGKTRKVWTLPPNVRWLGATGDDVLLGDSAGTVRIYSCRALLNGK